MCNIILFCVYWSGGNNIRQSLKVCCTVYSLCTLSLFFCTLKRCGSQLYIRQILMVCSNFCTNYVHNCVQNSVHLCAKLCKYCVHLCTKFCIFVYILFHMSEYYFLVKICIHILIHFCLYCTILCKKAKSKIHLVRYLHLPIHNCTIFLNFSSYLSNYFSIFNA